METAKVTRWWQDPKEYYPDGPRGTFVGENLGTRATNVLRMFGANSKDEAIQIICHRIKDIKRTSNCGKKTVKELQQWRYAETGEQSETECITIPQHEYDALLAERDKYKAAINTLLVRSCCKPCDNCFKTLSEAVQP